MPSKMNILKKLSSNAALGFSIFFFSVLFPPFENQTTVDLSTHMLQHVLIVFSGFLVAYPYLSSKTQPKYGTVGFIIVSFILVFWHLPAPWDDAVLNPVIHALEHLSFFLAGIISGSVLVKMSDTAKVSMMLAGFFGHTAYAIILIYPSSRIYYLYTYADQYLLGVLLLLSGSLFLVGVAYFVARNPSWLGGAAGSINVPKISIRSGRKIKAVLSLAFLISLLAYSSVALTLASLAKNTGGGVTVYIEETPLSWNYEPSNITVVIGINNTVTWISHSISYDTVTDVAGSFSSPPIPPGGTYSHTFVREGVYKYYCVYHPWMVGYITVKTRTGSS